MRCTCLHPACTSAAPEAVSNTCAVPRLPSSRSSVSATRRSLGDSRTCHAKGVPQGCGSSQVPRILLIALAIKQAGIKHNEDCCLGDMCVNMKGSG